MLEIGPAGGAPGEHHHPGILLVVQGQGGKGTAQGLQKAGQPAQGGFPVEAGQGPGHQDTVLQGIAGPGRGLGAIVEHPETPIGQAHQIGAMEDQPGTAGLDSGVDRAQEPRMGKDQFRGQQSARQYRGRTVEVIQQPLQQSDPLDQPGLHPVPLKAIDQQGHRIQYPGPLGLPGIIVEAIGHPVVLEQPLDLGKGLPATLSPTALGQLSGHPLPVGAQPSRRIA